LQVAGPSVILPPTQYDAMYINEKGGSTTIKVGLGLMLRGTWAAFTTLVGQNPNEDDCNNKYT